MERRYNIRLDQAGITVNNLINTPITTMLVMFGADDALIVDP